MLNIIYIINILYSTIDTKTFCSFFRTDAFGSWNLSQLIHLTSLKVVWVSGTCGMGASSLESMLLWSAMIVEHRVIRSHATTTESVLWQRGAIVILGTMELIANSNFNYWIWIWIWQNVTTFCFFLLISAVEFSGIFVVFLLKWTAAAYAAFKMAYLFISFCRDCWNGLILNLLGSVFAVWW